jgi:hypothetical protein
MMKDGRNYYTELEEASSLPSRWDFLWGEGGYYLIKADLFHLPFLAWEHSKSNVVYFRQVKIKTFNTKKRNDFYVAVSRNV